MDKKYITLFKDLAQATAISAERVMDYDDKQGDKAGLESAKTLREDFQELADRIIATGDNYVINKNDAARLLVGVLVMVNQLSDQIEIRRKAITSYQTDIVPKLQKIVDEAKSDEEAKKLANENFIIENNN